MAVVSPASAVALVEPHKKRARLLEAMAAELGLANVEVYPSRAEEAGRGPLRDAATLVTARAVAPLPELLEYVAPFAAPGALIALPKGSGLDDEVAAAARVMEALNCELCAIEQMRPAVSDVVRVALLRKTGPTPERYPRRPGAAAKRAI
jgi:16S rRNA (guanine527-N7)-methyltransferase